MLIISSQTLSSGHLGGNGISVMLGPHDGQRRQMPARQIDEERGVRARRDLGGDFGRLRCRIWA